jgi:quercetin dioxygenase-like cupin family protein
MRVVGTYGGAMTQVLNTSDLPGAAGQFEGYHYGDVAVSFFVSATPPGRGPALHRHPYAEVFVVQAGTLSVTVGEDTIEAQAGQIIVVPAGVPHAFTNRTTDIVEHIDIHACGRMETTWRAT